MTTLDTIRQMNPDYQILSLDDSDFDQYGKCYFEYDLTAVKQYMADNIEIPITGNSYVPVDTSLESIATIQKIGADVFAGLTIEAGECMGQADNFTAIEYHQGSEVNVMLTDVVMVLGKRAALENNHGFFDTDQDAQLFFVPAGTVIELYSGTLHYTPIKVHQSGFKVIVMLIAGTNQPLADDYQTTNERIVKVNKFQLVHPTRTDKIALGIQVGLKGQLITLKSLA